MLRSGIASFTGSSRFPLLEGFSAPLELQWIYFKYQTTASARWEHRHVGTARKIDTAPAWSRVRWLRPSIRQSFVLVTLCSNEEDAWC